MKLNESNLKKAGLKITQPRRHILEILKTAKNRHMSAEDVYRQLLNIGQEIGLATVYRVLTQFEAAGLVIRRYFAGGISVFELNHGMQHDHVICIQCGSVEEFSDQIIENRQCEIAKQIGYLVTAHHFTIHGICGTCQQKDQLF